MSLSTLSKSLLKLKGNRSANNNPSTTPDFQAASQPLAISTSDDDMKDIYKIHEDECIDVLFTKDDVKLGIEIKKYQPKGCL
jgi:hypothetical protein